MSVNVGLQDKELEAYYQSLFVMYASGGWASLLEDVKKLVDVYGNTRNVDRDSVDFVKGQLHILDWLAVHKEVTERAYAEQLAEESGLDVSPQAKVVG